MKKNNKNYKTTKMNIQKVLVELQNWNQKTYWINKEQFSILQVYEWQYFMKEDWTVWVLENLRDKIKIIPKIKYIREYASDTKK